MVKIADGNQSISIDALQTKQREKRKAKEKPILGTERRTNVW